MNIISADLKMGETLLFNHIFRSIFNDLITYFKNKVKLTAQYQKHNVIAFHPTLNMEQQFQSTLTPKSTDFCDLIIMQSSLLFLSG